MPTRKLITLLADNQTHHITELASLVHCKPYQLNALWQQTPAHIRGLLRQKDGFWRLIRPLALLPQSFTHPDFHIQILEETTSSNDELLNAARQGQNTHRHVIVAEQQSNGRGRQGKTWHSRLGECLMFSLAWEFDLPQAALSSLAPTVALACQKALAIHQCHTQIKWPNDLVVGLDKLGGILIETLRQNGKTIAIIGIGINFVLPKTIENSVSIQSLGQKITTSDFFTTLLTQLHHHLENFSSNGFAPLIAEYQTVHRDHNAQVHLIHENQILHTGTITGIREDGALLLETAQGKIAALNGEISLRRPEQHLSSKKPSKDLPCLLLDGGNSRLKWAWLQEGQIGTVHSAPYRDLSNLGRQWQQRKHIPHQILGSAVCGTTKQEQVAQQLENAHIQWLSSVKHACGIFNHYRNPEEHGADRWFNALGSRNFSQQACIIVSCGTAVTIDALTADNHYLGGTIMPGFHLMKEALLQKTANLNRPDGLLYPFPTTTANAISSGMMDAVCGSLLLMHSRLKERNPQQTVDVILTGGGASKVAAALPEDFKHQNHVQVIDNLVLYGLLMYKKQQKAA